MMWFLASGVNPPECSGTQFGIGGREHPLRGSNKSLPTTTPPKNRKTATAQNGTESVESIITSPLIQLHPALLQAQKFGPTAARQFAGGRQQHTLPIHRNSLFPQGSRKPIAGPFPGSYRHKGNDAQMLASQCTNPNTEYELEQRRQGFEVLRLLESDTPMVLNQPRPCPIAQQETTLFESTAGAAPRSLAQTSGSLFAPWVSRIFEVFHQVTNGFFGVRLISVAEATAQSDDISDYSHRNSNHGQRRLALR